MRIPITIYERSYFLLKKTNNYGLIVFFFITSHIHIHNYELMYVCSYEFVGSLFSFLELHRVTEKTMISYVINRF